MSPRTITSLPPLVLLAALGCADSAPPSGVAPDADPTPAATRFDPTACADVRGRIVWRGPAPAVPPLEHPRLVGRATPDGPPALAFARWPNPHAPRVGPDGGLAGAVVFLRGVDPAAARPWDHPPASVEARGERLAVVQGGQARSVGWVRPGETVAFANRDPCLESLRATALGAEGGLLFTLPLPDADRPLGRCFRRAGCVAVTSGSRHYWMSAHLWVADHPYFAVTDERGRFELPQVPAGPCEVVCWHPNWRTAGHDRDPETGLVIRQHFAPPAAKSVPLEVAAGVALELRLPVDESDFPAPPGAD